MLSNAFNSLLLASLASLQSISASPITLESRSNILVARGAQCPAPGSADNFYVDGGAASQLAQHYKSLGTQICDAMPQGFYQTQNTMAAIYFQSNTGRIETSYCSDFGIGIQQIIDACKRADGKVTGSNAPNGNGNILLSILPPQVTEGRGGAVGS